MDYTQLVVALFTLIGVVLSAYLGAKKAGDVAEERQNARIDELRLLEQIHHEQTQEAIERLEKKQDKHNGLVEKVYEHDKRISLIEKGASS